MQNLISCDEETSQDASAISMEGFESETLSDVSSLPNDDSIAAEEREEQLDALENFRDNDWLIARKFTRRVMLGLLYLLHEFLENRSHQPRRSECMDRIEELSQINPYWAKQTNLNNLRWKGMREAMKAM